MVRTRPAWGNQIIATDTIDWRRGSLSAQQLRLIEGGQLYCRITWQLPGSATMPRTRVSRSDALTVAKFLQHRIWPRFTHQFRSAIRGAQSGHEKATDPRPPDRSNRPRNFSAQTTLPITRVSAGRSCLFIDLVLAAFAQAISVGLLRLPTTADFQYQNPSGSGPVFRVAFQPLAAPDWAPLERRFAGAVIGGEFEEN
jgi:hypothetical protein